MRITRPNHATTIAYLALFLALSGTAVAATGGSLIIGRQNAAGTTTSLTNPNGIALSLGARSGSAPLAVNSSTKVSRLNSDLLDGLDSSGLQRRISTACATGNAIRAVGATGVPACVSIPTGGLAGPTDLSAFYRAIEPSVVIVTCQTSTAVSLGSGFVYNEPVPPAAASSGYKVGVFTNEHVIHDCETAGNTATVSQGSTSFRTRLWSWDEPHDVAVLMVDASLPGMGFAESAPPVGTWGAAFGAPRAFEGTMTTGIVSNRSLREDLLLSDVSITHGNSGGPFVNKNGEVLGLATGGVPDSQNMNLITTPDALCGVILDCGGTTFWPTSPGLRREGSTNPRNASLRPVGQRNGPPVGPEYVRY